MCKTAFVRELLELLLWCGVAAVVRLQDKKELFAWPLEQECQAFSWARAPALRITDLGLSQKSTVACASKVSCDKNDIYISYPATTLRSL